MKKAEKEKLVADLTGKLKDSKSLYYTDFTGLNVKRMTELRRRLKRALARRLYRRIQAATRPAAQFNGLTHAA